ncbi:hypothetical protein BC829DRAFT_386141 [Chytridium lagenaria]|nr:hypothetical protein BC829DRAFT_386141 [Chytridium lagenaria]
MARKKAYTAHKVAEESAIIRHAKSMVKKRRPNDLRAVILANRSTGQTGRHIPGRQKGFSDALLTTHWDSIQSIPSIPDHSMTISTEFSVKAHLINLRRGLRRENECSEPVIFSFEDPDDDSCSLILGSRHIRRKFLFNQDRIEVMPFNTIRFCMPRTKPVSAISELVVRFDVEGALKVQQIMRTKSLD